MKEDRGRRYDRINVMLEPLRVAKRNTIHTAGRIGQNHPILRIPILVVLCVFLFIYNVFLYTFLHFKMKEKLARTLAMVLAVAMIFSNIGLVTFAMDIGEENTETVEESADTEDEAGDAEDGEEPEGDDASGDDGDAADGDNTDSSQSETQPASSDTEESSDISYTEENTESLTEETTEELTEETTEEIIEKEDVKFDESKTIGDICIKVYADKGVFPEGARLDVTVIDDDEDVEEIEQMVAGELDKEAPADEVTIVEKSYSYDITILDEDGNEIEPDTSKGEVRVVFENVGVTEVCDDDGLEMNVFHVEDDLSDVEKIEDVTLDADDDSASISAEHFSIYTVVITSGEKKGTILNYYQGTNKNNSYFTIYNGTQLIKYKDLINSYASGKIEDDDTIETILVNKDDSNPTEGIVGLGQATDMSVSDINFSAKLMDDITVSDTWTIIEEYPPGVKFEGDDHTITFETSAIARVTCNDTYGPFVTTNKGIIKNLVIKYNGKTKTIGGIRPAEEKYASVTVRVDGEKAEIGQAITGAEALAISCDGGRTYITLERGDDLSTYRTKFTNLKEVEPEEPTTEDPDDLGAGEPEDPEYLEYDIYYVYEDENETISAAKLNKTNSYKVELNYVSVTYNMEYANTYSEGEDGKLSEKVMAAVRVQKNADGTYTALEDYDAVLEAVSGHDVPSRAKNVMISVSGVNLTLNTDYTYDYDPTLRRGNIHVSKDKITGPMIITVKADSLEDSPKNTITLCTLGGTVADPTWNKTAAGQYTSDVYEDTVLPTDVNPLNGANNLKFAGWYDNIACTGNAVTNYRYVESTTAVKKTYYAKWIIQNQAANNGSIQYYATRNMDIRGLNNGNTIQTTYSDSGYQYYSDLGSVNIPYNNSDLAFGQLGGSDLYIARLYSFEGGYINFTYVIANRGTATYTKDFWLTEDADVQIGNNDSAPINYVNSGSSTYITMEDGEGSVFKLYLSGSDMGIDAVTSWWYGKYSLRTSYRTTCTNPTTSLTGTDSGIAFGWKITDDIPAGGYIIRTTKMGVGAAGALSGATLTVDAKSGQFEDGRKVASYQSTSGQITVNNDGTIDVKSGSSTTTVKVPTRTGYVFDHWSAGSEGAVSAAGKTYTENITLVANYVPKPDVPVTNNSSIQKVEGNNDLMVPKEVGSIVITNTTVGVDEDSRIIGQGETKEDSAGFASGFNGIISIESVDDRYLLPDDIKVEAVDDSGNRVLLTKDTGYTYELWNNRKKANIEIFNRCITGRLEITAIGYELPPVTATSVSARAKKSTIGPDDTATFIAEGQTSKNHTATYEWYIAPYFKSVPLDGVCYWNYQNQNGTKLENGTGTYTFTIGDSGDSKTVTIDVSGADKPTLRIKGLNVNQFKTASGASPDPAAVAAGLHFGGYHVYCRIVSVRNITGQESPATSNVVEVEVATGVYEAPTGIEGSATSYYGSKDGVIEIEKQSRPAAMQYRKSPSGTWNDVTESMLNAGKIEGLEAGTYDFKYKADANHSESAPTQVTVANGKYIIVTYKAAGADDESKRTQLKHVTYNSTVTAATASAVAADGSITAPTKTGYTFSKWEPETVNNIRENTTVEAVYTNNRYTITLDNKAATTAGTTAIYEKYSNGFFTDSTCAVLSTVSGSIPISVPTKQGYIFKGYYTSADGGTKMINEDGRLTENMSATYFAANTTLYAVWEAIPVNMSVRETVDNPVLTSPSGGVTMTVLDSEGKEVKSAGGYDPDTTYTVKIDAPQDECDTVYAYSDGEYVREIDGITFTSSRANYITTYSTSFEFKPSDIGGNNIVFVAAKLAQGGNIEEQAKENEYTITYREYNSSKTGTEFSGTFTDAAPAKGMNGLATVLPGATKNGYTFAGWYTTVWCNGTPITEIPSDNTRDVTLYAKWNPMKYNIFLVDNGGTYVDGLTLPTQYTHGGSDVELPTGEQISRVNYDFTGWYDNEDLNGTPVSVVSAAKVGAVTYYAGWQLKALHTITLSNDGVSGSIYTINSLDGYTTSVYHGDDYKFTVDIASAYGIKSVKRDGKLLSPDADGVYTVANVIDDTAIEVTYELLAATTDNNGEALIELADGTIGYFETIEDAIDYASKHGSNSVIKVRQDIVAADIEAAAGNSYTIDLCGYSLGTGAKMLIVPGANVTLTDSDSADEVDVEIDNKGEFTNKAIVSKIENYGILYNEGTIATMIQGDADDGSVTKTVDSGTISHAVLNSGYLVAEGSSRAPEGLSGHTTIMNGNEYYHDFNDAVKIAGNADEDSVILMLGTVDNNGETLTLGNSNDKKITIDMNGKEFAGGTLKVTGDIEFTNSAGNPGSPNKITSIVEIAPTGVFTVGSAAKTDGNITNNGTLCVEEGGTTSAEITNKEGATINNSGNILSAMTNYGTINNNENGSMQNVTQLSGRTYNHGNVTGTMQLTGGSYTCYGQATPSSPTGKAVKVVESEDPSVITYYPTLKEAIDDANTVTEPNPFVIELLENISELGDSPVVLDPAVGVVIELDGHTLGDGSGDTLVIGGNPGGDGNVTLEGPGEVKSDVEAKPDADVTIGGGDEATNNIEVSGKYTNSGHTTNNGTLDDVAQTGGTLENKEGAEIKELVQTGGNTKNEGNVVTATVNGGGYEGNEPTDDSGSNVGKVAVIEGTPNTYFADLDSALEYAATNGGMTVKLLNDIDGENISLSSGGTVILDTDGHKIKNTSTLSVGSNTTLTINSGTVEAPITVAGKVNITENAVVTGDVTIENYDSAIVQNEGKIEGNVVSNGTLINAPGADVAGVTVESGTFRNSGDCDSVTLNGGLYIYSKAEGGEPSPRTPGVGATSVITESSDPLVEVYFNKLDEAIEYANESDKDNVTITLIDDATLPESTPTTLGDDTDITIDLNGHDITGGTLEISGDAEIIDNSGEEPGGTVNSDIVVDDTASLDIEDVTVSGDIDNNGNTTIGEDTTVSGDVVNNGEFVNDGTISGNIVNNESFTNNGDITEDSAVTNSGEFDNSGNIDGDVTQSAGTFTNEAGGSVATINVSGGAVDNGGEINEANVSGGEYHNTGSGSTGSEDHTGARVSITRDGETKYYENVNAAIADAEEGDVIKLLEDIGGDKPSEDIVIGVEGITIDLNGHSIGEGSTITVTENGSITEIKNTGSEDGEITAPVTNNGELTLNENVKVDTIVNNGTLDNKGEINTLTNNGEAVNNGKITTVDQEEGSLVNNGEIAEVELNGGGYSGNEPTTPISDEDKKVKVGDTYYGDLESAIEAANEATTDVTIILYDDQTITDGTQIGNENGKNITIDTNGHDVTGDPTITGRVTIDDNSDTPGVWNGDVVVNNPASLVIGENTTINGDIDNGYEVENYGHIIGDVNDGGLMINEGGIIDGEVNIDGDGMFENNYIDEEHPGYVQGDINNEGIFENNGIVSDVNNSGEGFFENTGSVDGNVVNSDNASFENKSTGSVGGEFTNEGNAVTTNDGSLNQLVVNGGEVRNGENGDINQISQSSGSVESEGDIGEYTKTGGETVNSGNGSIDKLTQSGGSTNNSGTIDELTQSGGSTNNGGGTIGTADITNGIGNYTGNLPNTSKPGGSLDDIQVAVTTTDPTTGEQTTRYYENIDDAIDAAIASGEGNPTVEVVKSPAEITKNTVIPENMTIVVPEGTTLNIPDGVTVDNKGTIDNNGTIDNEGTVTNEGTLSNSGSLNNTGTVENKEEAAINNSGSVINNGSITNEENAQIKNSGDISNVSETSTFDNSGEMNNTSGTINAADGAAGKTVNSGTITGGSITGPAENTADGKMSKQDKLAGEIDNSGAIEVTPRTDTSDAEVTNEEGASLVLIPDPVPPRDDSDDDSDDEDEDDTTPVIKQPNTTPAVVAGADGTNGNGTAGGNGTGGNGDMSTLGNGNGTGGVNIIAESGITSEEAISAFESEDEEGKKLAQQLIERAIETGNVRIGGADNTDSLTNETSGNRINASIDESNLADVVGEILTTEEKIAMLNGENVTVRAEVNIIITDEVDEATKNAGEAALTDDLQSLSYFTIDLYKQVGNRKEVVVPSKNVRVTIEVPEKDRVTDDEAVYQIMRIYTDENGEVRAEIVESVRDGFFLTFEADTESQYVIVCNGKDQYSVPGFDSSKMGELTKAPDDSDADNLNLYWIIVLAALGYAAAIYLIRNKDKKQKTVVTGSGAVALAAVTVACIIMNNVNKTDDGIITAGVGEDVTYEESDNTPVQPEVETDSDDTVISDAVVSEETATSEEIATGEEISYEEPDNMDDGNSVPEAEPEETVDADNSAIQNNAEDMAVDENESEDVTIVVEAGMYSDRVAKVLQEAGIIEDAHAFDLYLCQNGYDTGIKVGEHVLNAAMSEEELAQALQ